MNSELLQNYTFHATVYKTYLQFSNFVYGSQAFLNPVIIIMIMCSRSVNESAHLMCREWHAITVVTFSHLLTTTVVSTAPNTRVQLTHLSNLTLLYREYDDI